MASSGAADEARSRAGGMSSAPGHPGRRLSPHEKLVALVSQLRGCLGSIPAREKRTLTLLTGVGGGRSHSERQVARILNVSARRERQIEQAAVAGLRKANAHTACGTAAQPGPAIARAVAAGSAAIIELLQGTSPATTPAVRPQTGQGRTTSRSGVGPQLGTSPSAPAPLPPAPPKSGVISAPENSGMDWALLATAIALLLGAAAFVILRRRSPLPDGTVAGAAAAGAGIERARSRSATVPSLHWRPRLSRLAALVGGLTALPLLSQRRTKRAAAEDEHEVATPPPAPTPIAARRRPPVKATEPRQATAAPTPAGASHADISDAASAFALATVLEKRGDRAGAEGSYRSADALGHPEAAFHLGGMYAEGGDFEAAEACYRRADQLGHGDGAFNLGVLLEHRNDRSKAEAAYRRADERGHMIGAFNLGVLLDQRGDHAGAEAAYRRADERGDVGAAYTLGTLLRHRGDRDGAEGAFRRADERGDAAAAFSLGGLLAERGKMADAEAAFRRADERGDAAAAFSLGGLLTERGDLRGAEEAFGRADERGHVAGAFNLGVLLEERGDLEGAETAYHRAEQRGHGDVAEMARAALLELWGQR